MSASDPPTLNPNSDDPFSSTGPYAGPPETYGGAPGTAIRLRKEDHARLFDVITEAQEASSKMVEAVIAAAGIDISPSPLYGGSGATLSWVYDEGHPGVVAAVIATPTDPPMHAYVYYIDGEAVDVVYPAYGPVFPH